MNLVGNNIRKVRMARSMTQTDLADLLGRNQRTISNWEKGIRDPGSDNIRAIADILDISPAELIGHNNAPADNSFQLIAESNSMAPEIKEGDTITVSKISDVKDGDICIVSTKSDPETAICCRIYFFDNKLSLSIPDNKPIVVEKEDATILGRVVEIRRRF